MRVWKSEGGGGPVPLLSSLFSSLHFFSPICLTLAIACLWMGTPRTKRGSSRTGVADSRGRNTRNTLRAAATEAWTLRALPGAPADAHMAAYWIRAVSLSLPSALARKPLRAWNRMDGERERNDERVGEVGGEREVARAASAPSPMRRPPPPAPGVPSPRGAGCVGKGNDEKKKKNSLSGRRRPPLLARPDALLFFISCTRPPTLAPAHSHTTQSQQPWRPSHPIQPPAFLA